VHKVLNSPDALRKLDLRLYQPLLEEVSSIFRERLDPAIIETLRPLNWQEVREIHSAGHEIAGHTVDHAILGAQSPAVRRHQILRCIETIEDMLKIKVAGFAYPNGGPGDFGEEDRRTLRAARVHYAVTTRSGYADEHDRFELPRLCIGRGHTRESFLLELTGLLDERRRRQQGWQ
jgi:hypothetical protein